MDAGTLISVLIVLAICIATVVAISKIYSKAGQGALMWIVPIYGTIVLMRIIGRPWWWGFLPTSLTVPFDLAKSYGKGAGMGILCYLFIGYLIIGLGGARYVGPVAAQRSPGMAAA